MLRFQAGLAGAALAATLLALPHAAVAQSAEMTDAERAAFRAEVRAFLLEEPEVIAEALQALERRRVERAVESLELLVSDGERVVDRNVAGADLTIIEFTDYNCPYCRRAQPEVAEFVETDGKVRHVVKALPYIGSDRAERAMVAAVRQGDYAVVEAFHTALMSIPGRLDDAAIERIAAEAGVDAERMLTEMMDDTTQNVLARTVEIARALEIQGTPAFIIGGEVIGGLRSAAELAEIAAEVRARSGG